MLRKVLLPSIALLLAAVALILLLDNRKPNTPNPPEPQPISTVAPTGTEVITTEEPTIEPTTAAVTEPPQFNPVLPAPDQAAERLNVPQGFAIRIFADNIRGTPRFMTVGPDGEVYISLYASGEIARLRPE